MVPMSLWGVLLKFAEDTIRPGRRFIQGLEDGLRRGQIEIVEHAARSRGRLGDLIPERFGAHWAAQHGKSKHESCDVLHGFLQGLWRAGSEGRPDRRHVEGRLRRSR